VRTKDPDPPTRNKLLDAAEELMLSKGYVATSLDEICGAAGVTKGSFFTTFRARKNSARCS
jgi:TetR/AcrR family transcriptional repressor of nem operon